MSGFFLASHRSWFFSRPVPTIFWVESFWVRIDTIFFINNLKCIQSLKKEQFSTSIGHPILFRSEEDESVRILNGLESEFIQIKIAKLFIIDRNGFNKSCMMKITIHWSESIIRVSTSYIIYTGLGEHSIVSPAEHFYMKSNFPIFASIFRNWPQKFEGKFSKF